MSNKSKRLDYVDVLRVVALGSVIFFHYFFSAISRGNLTSVDRSPIFGIAQYGYLGVELFFTISGFVILYSTQNRKFLDFWKRRFWRLYPMYWIGMTFVFIVSNLWFWNINGPNVKRLLVGFTMFPTAFGYDWVDPAHWFLARELQFYVFVSFFMLIGLGKKLPQIFPIWAIVLMIWNVFELKSNIFWYTNGLFSFMCAGAILFSIREWGWTPMRIIGLIAAYITGMHTRIHSVHWLDTHRKSPHSALVIGIVVTAIYLIMLATMSSKISAWTASWVTFAGALTYAVFAILRSNQSSIRTYSWSNLLRDVRYFMRVNRYSQIPQIMTGQLISPAQPVFAVTATSGGGRGGVALELTSSGSVGIVGGGKGSRDVLTSESSSTLFSFKPKSGSNTPRHGIQFIH